MTPKQQAAMQQALEALEKTGIEGTWELHEAAITALRAALAEPLQTCACRWDGEVQVQQCNLHQAHIDAIHDWAERAKTAEKKLVALSEILMPNQRRLFGYRDKRQREVEAARAAIAKVEGEKT